MNIPYLIQEQNSYAGITNKWLGKNAKLICVAFEGMEKFFPKAKILLTGNPIRKEAVDIENKRFEAAELLSLSPHKKTILITGGSLGSATLNKSVLAAIDKIIAADVQIIWQTGKYYFQSINEQLKGKEHPNLKVLEFLHRMDLAYAACDLVISRAGAGTIAELCAVKKPTILVPSPNVAEDHQTKNANALVVNNAAILVTDANAENELMDRALILINNKEKCKELANQIGKMELPHSDEIIAKEVFKLAK
jgi:UDP-N-acetylglucosamine--N-acetylmuramyl-(pentapeptide) pyrophosphoryl-undecaprenol N-acetylglucosamine transferase